MNGRLLRCLNPESIAVVGGREVERVIFQCRKLGFAGDIQVVNPRRQSLCGLPCHHSVSALPAAPDAAFVAIPAEPSIEVVRELSVMGAGGVVCYASGFREVGHSDRHDRLLAAAGGMPVIGPNCHGFVNAMNGAVLWPDQHGMGRCDSGVAIFSASGNISINMTMQQRGLPLALMISIGNQAMVGVEDCLDAMLEDHRIRAVGMLVEGLKDLPRFVAVVERAVAAGKPVVVLKNGRSAAGARMTMSHTATLAGESGLYDALFRRLGVAQAHDLETFLESLKLLSIHGPLPGRRIASMSCSGGEASMIADLAEPGSLEFPPLSDVHRESVRSTLNEYVNVDNPLDYHTFIWGDSVRLERMFGAMLEGGFDLTLLLLDYPLSNDCDVSEWVEAGRAFVRACHAGGHRGALVVSMPENVSAETIAEMHQAGIPVLLGIPQSLGAIEAAVSAGPMDQPLPVVKPLSAPRAGDAGRVRRADGMVNEYEAKIMLGGAGFTVPDGRLAEDAEAAVDAADELGYPVALKMVAGGVAHKSELGGVHLGLADADGVRKAAHALLAHCDRMLVESMAPPGIVELIVGMARDPQFGHYLIVGLGGTLVELYADRTILLPPFSDDQVRSALSGLRSAPLLSGYRGAAVADVDAVVRAIQRLQEFIVSQGDALLEMEINPLIVHPEGAGATVADALIVYRQDT
jgi:acyl-CoA synthetase (NDP forming)